MKKLTLFSVLSAVTAVTSLSLACPGHEGGRAKMDTNGDGKVTLDEMRAGAKLRFDALDTDKNGVLSKAEIEKAPHKRMIEHADANKDGQVTAAESVAAVDGFFKKLDKNNDGTLTGDELRFGHRGHRDHEDKKS